MEPYVIIVLVIAIIAVVVSLGIPDLNSLQNCF